MSTPAQYCTITLVLLVIMKTFFFTTEGKIKTHIFLLHASMDGKTTALLKMNSTATIVTSMGQ